MPAAAVAILRHAGKAKRTTEISALILLSTSLTPSVFTISQNKANSLSHY